MSLRLDISKQRAILAVEDLDDLSVASEQLFRLWVELYALNWKSVVVAELVDGHWIAHIVHENFALLSTDRYLQSLSWFKADACDLLVREHLLQIELLRLFLLLDVKELHSSVDSTTGNQI